MGVSSLPKEDKLVEFWWTFVPSCLVGILCFLNLRCLVEAPFSGIYRVVKVVGHQWYWSYEIAGVERSYDSLNLSYLDSVDKPLRLV